MCSIISLLQYTYCILPVQVPFAGVPRFVGTLPVGATSRCLSAPAKQSPTPSTLPAIFHRRPLLLLIYSLLTHCQFTLSFDIEIIVRDTSNRKTVYISYHLISTIIITCYFLLLYLILSAPQLFSALQVYLSKTFSNIVLFFN